MGKWWQIINVDKRESSQHLWGELGSWFFYPHEHLLTHISVPCLPKEVDKWLAEGTISSQPGPLSHMPVELLDLFFDELPGLHEVIALSITCKPLLAVGKRHLLRATRAHYAPWVGCRLISLDDGTRSLDALPPRLLAPAERAEIAAADFPKYTAASEQTVEKSLSNFASHYYARVFHKEWRQPRINDASTLEQRLRRRRVPLSPSDRDSHCDEDGDGEGSTEHDARMFRALYGDGRRAAAYPAGTRVLCNLSKGEYVRADGLRAPPHANLAHALLARVCWSSDREVGMVCADGVRPQLTAGSWAGDRFCVTVLEALPELEEGVHGEDRDGNEEKGHVEKMEWRDVTREVAEVLAHIWENNSAKWVVFCK